MELYLLDEDNMNQAVHTHFIRNLLEFFRPYQSAFIELSWQPSNFHFAHVGCRLINLCVNHSTSLDQLVKQQFSQGQWRSFLEEVYMVLDRTGQDILNKFVSLQTQMIRLYVVWAAQFSQNEEGLEYLHQAGLVKLFYSFVRKHQLMIDNLVVHFAINIDLRRTEFVKYFMLETLLYGSDYLQLQLLEHIRTVFRLDNNYFKVHLLSVLVLQLTRNGTNALSVEEKIIDIFKEIVMDNQVLLVLINNYPYVIDYFESDQQDLFIQFLRIKKGFLLIQKNKREWFEEQVETQIASKIIPYSMKIDQLLMKGLDFNEKSDDKFNFFNKYVNKYQYNMLIRVPFNLYIVNISNLDDKQIKETVYFSTKYYYHNNSNKIQIVFEPQYQDSQKVLTLNKRNKFDINFRIGMSNIDINFNEKKQQENNIITYFDLKFNKIFDDEFQIVEKNGMELFFDQDKTLMKISITINFISEFYQDQILPCNFIASLVKNKMGAKFLRCTPIIQQLKEILLNQNSSGIETKSCLWALGFIGKTKHGIQILMENNLIKEIFKILNESGNLSLRGICVYVLNLISITLTGSQEIEKYDWFCFFKKTQGKKCLPNKIQSIFNLKPNQNQIALSNQWPLKSEFWDYYQKQQSLFNHNVCQLQLIKYFQMLSNKLIENQAITEIRKTYDKHPEYFIDRFIFYHVLLLLIFYKFSFKNRKFIWKCFERLLNSQNIFMVVDSNPTLNITPIYNHKSHQSTPKLKRSSLPLQKQSSALYSHHHN